MSQPGRLRSGDLVRGGWWDCAGVWVAGEGLAWLVKRARRAHRGLAGVRQVAADL